MRVVTAAAFLIALGLAATAPLARAQAPRDAAPLAAPPATGTAVISGRVTIRNNGQVSPVRRARVSVESVAAGTIVRADTDVDGRYRITQLQAGDYRVVAEKAGVVAATTDPRRAFERPAPISVASNRATTVDLLMQPGAAVEGVVLREDGDPAMNISVSAIRSVYDANGRRTIAFRQTRTDDRGLYRLHTLPPGEYLVEAAPDSLAPTAPANGQRRPEPARTYYPGTPQVEQAQRVVLDIGESIRSANFTLSSVTKANLRGNVVDASGRNVLTYGLRLQRVGGPTGEVRGLVVPQTGEFQMPNVPPGEYWVLALVRPSADAPAECAVQRIAVNGVDPPPLALKTARGPVVTGRVEVEGGATPLPPGLVIIAHETAFEMPTIMGSTATTGRGVVDPSGTFALDGLCSPRIVRIDRLPAGWALTQVMLEADEITDAATTFATNATPQRLRVIITPTAATARGVVHDEQGRPIANARVVVFGEDAQKWGPRSRVVRAAESSADGRFGVDGLPGGRYFAVAVPFLDDNAWTDVGVLQRLQPIATEIRLVTGQTTTITLKVK